MNPIQENKLKTTIKNYLQDNVGQVVKGKQEKVSRSNYPMKYFGKLNKDQLEALRKFDNVMNAKGNGLYMRCNTLKWLRAFLVSTGKELKDIESQDVADFMANYDNFHTKRAIWTACDHFFTWYKKPEVTENLKPTSKKILNKLKDTLTQEEILKLISVANNFRDRAMVSVCYDGGLRAGELLNLKYGDLFFDDYGCKLRIVDGKTESEGFVRLHSSLPDLNLWLSSHPARQKEEIPDETFLFCGYARGDNVFKTNPLSWTAFHLLLKNLMHKSGLKKNVHPHLLRHSRAKIMLIDQKMPLPVVQKHLRHKRITSTEIYLNYGYKNYEDSFLSHLGLKRAEEEEKEKKKVLEPIKCFCGHKNSATALFCASCNRPISLEGYSQVENIAKQKANLGVENVIQRVVEKAIEEKLKASGVIS